MVQRTINTTHRALSREKELEDEVVELKQQLKAQAEKHSVLEAGLNALEVDLKVKFNLAQQEIADLQRQLGGLATRKELDGKHAEAEDKKIVGIDENLNKLDSEGGFPLYGAAAGGHYADVRQLLERGADPSMRTRFRWTALHWAVGNGFPDVVRLLLDHGADVNAVSDTGMTPLQMAKQEEIRSMLLERGAMTKKQLRG